MQQGAGIRFSTKPSDLAPLGQKPLWQCKGWRQGGGDCKDGYATDDIFFLEVRDSHVTYTESTLHCS